MVYRKPGRESGRKRASKAWIVILVVVLVLAGGVAAFFLLGGPSLFAPKEPPAPYFAAGEVRAVALTAPEKALDEEGLRAYFEEAAAAAAENGCNTILFRGKDGLAVYWRDKVFSAPAAVREMDGLFYRADPLAMLCEAAAAKGVQVWLEVDPYATGNYEEGMKGSAVKLAEAQGGAGHTAFAPNDKEYSALLLESLAQLPMRYPLAGIIIDGRAADAQDPAALGAGLGEVASGLDAALAEAGLQTRTGLRLDGAGRVMDTEAVRALAAQSGLAYLLPELSPGQGLYQRLNSWGSLGPALVAVQPAGEEKEDLLFTAAGAAGYAGAVLGSYPAVFEDTARLAYLTSALAAAEGQRPSGYTVPGSLAVNYPLQSDSIGSGQALVYVMGTSDPSQPLMMNGEEVPRYTSGGTFGIAVPLQTGDNSFTFTNGQATLTHLITRPEPKEATAATPMPSDTTREAEPGEAVQVVGVFTGALMEPGDDGMISETLYGGAVGVVRSSVETVRYSASHGRNVRTWAYQLANGDYVLARNCVFVEGDGLSSFTGIAAEADERGEWLRFEGTGTPAVWMAKTGDTLSITMYDTAFTLPEGFASELVQGASVEPIENGVVLHLRGPQIWGYQVDYTGGQTRIFLNRAPARGSDPAKPLEGVRILLDPGHGDSDIGAPGIMGAIGPNEKDVNLAKAQAIAYRLRQLGAEVTMVREDDATFYEVAERLAMMIEHKPHFFIAVHHNSASMEGDRNEVSGLQVYYYSEKNNSAPISKGFGQNLMDATAAATGQGASESAWGYYTVLRSTVCPAVLFEYGFMVNPVEFERMIGTDNLYETACATAEGILNSIPG